MSINMMLFAFLPIILAHQTTQKVVTGIDCEVSNGDQEWHLTEYGKHGGRHGGWSDGSDPDEGRLFEFDCQTPRCRDSDEEKGHWWVTCGYSWQNVDEVTDSTYVIVDVKTEASNGVGSCNDNSYTRALDFDSTGHYAIDTHGKEGHAGFWICYKAQRWSQVKAENYQIVTGLAASTSSWEKYYTHIGQWDTSDNGDLAKAYGINGNWGTTRHWLHLFQMKAKPELPQRTKVIGSWISETVNRRPNNDIELEITKTAELSETEEVTERELNAWETRVASSIEAEVAVEASTEWKGISGSVSSRLTYSSEYERAESFESEVQELASKTYAQSTTVTTTFTIPKQVEGEPIHSNIWYFKIETITEDLKNGIHYMVDRGMEVHGCGYNIAPNCLPGHCAPYDPHCWSCSSDWAIINPDFTAPAWCGDEGEGCHWVPVSSDDCPKSSLARLLPECTGYMNDGDLCEANNRLPNGEEHNIDNCGAYDVFRYECD